MLNWALTFLLIALLAAILGFSGIAVAAAGIAKLLFVLFLVLFLASPHAVSAEAKSNNPSKEKRYGKKHGGVRHLLQ